MATSLKLKISDLVKYKHSHPDVLNGGLVMALNGTKWIKVLWSDKLITEEHIDDLEIIYNSDK